MKFDRAILFYHKGSGDDDIDKKLNASLTNLCHLCQELVIYESKKRGDIKEKCKNLDNFDIVIILGGDGTVFELINGMYENNIDIPIAILPGGTFNDFSKTLNISEDLFEASNSFKDAEIERYDAMLLNNTAVLNFVALGLPVNIALNKDEENKQSLGILSYVKSFFENTSNPELFDYELEYDGKSSKGRCTMILVLNGKSIVNVKLDDSFQSPQDAKLNIYILKDSSFATIAEVFNAVKNDDLIDKDKLEYHEAKNIKIISPKDNKLDTDGELFLKSPADIKILENRFRFLTIKKNRA
ncbi:MAG: diacylglycerol kinase family lipid kinase [Tissierellia bacterium]|nr:diacylglycerol kinase family lipid kinase [Tissierellia bacterium]